GCRRGSVPAAWGNPGLRVSPYGVQVLISNHSGDEPPPSTGTSDRRRPPLVFHGHASYGIQSNIRPIGRRTQASQMEKSTARRPRAVPALRLGAEDLDPLYPPFSAAFPSYRSN